MKPTKDQFLAAITRIERLSPAPRVLCRATALLRNPDADVADVVALIRVDAGLTADIIRGANSAFYGSDERVSSLERAVQKIGFRESIRLLNIAVTHLFAARDLGSYGISADAFWAESLFQGLFVEELAKATGAYDPDVGHTAGLLRFVGRLAINHSINELGAGLFWDGEMSLEQWELESVGFPQTFAAAALMRAWHFPEDLCLAVEWQNEPERAPDANGLAHALRFATQVVPQGRWLEFEPRVRITPPSSPFAECHGLTAERTDALLHATRRRYLAIGRTLYD